MMMCPIMCNRDDCEFHSQGSCSYGGDFLKITPDGCATYEPAEGVFDAAKIKADAQLTASNISSAITWVEDLFNSAADDSTATDYAVAIKALELVERIKELADAK